MLIVVAFDGKDVEPYKTDIVVISPGESVDFIIFTNRPRDNYRINYFITTFLDANGVSFIIFINQFVNTYVQLQHVTKQRNQAF